MLVSEGHAHYEGRVGGGCGDDRALAGHLAVCEVCREVAEAYARDADLIRQAVETIPIDPDFTTSVMRKIRRGIQRK